MIYAVISGALTRYAFQSTMYGLCDGFFFKHLFPCLPDYCKSLRNYATIVDMATVRRHAE